jgi:hypothetical protein|tara:strand:- start:316 stop:1881 length:1566 start_codon:yes stop_codon:yes gene_type:complete
MIHNIKNLLINFTLTTEEKEGVNFLVIPIIALVEGVHAGSGGAGFYPAAEINRTAQNWNGVPLTINHPQDNSGSPITANNPDILKQYAIGTFENVHYESGKLKGEGWIDVNRIELLSPETLEILRMGRKLEVSTGLFTGSDGMPGEWHGEKFEETLSDFIPDHLALLPNAEGACNFDAGCGVRANKNLGCGKCLVKKEGGEIVKKKDANVALSIDGVKLDLFTVLKSQGYWVNKISHSKIREQLFKLVSDMDKPGTMHFLREVFDKTFIFEKVTNNDSQLFRIGYKLNREDEITLGKGDPEEVKEKIDFISVNLSKEQIMDRKQEVDALIANEKLDFIEADRDMLTDMADESFDRLFKVNDCDCQDGKEELVKANETIATLTEELDKAKEDLKVNEDKKDEPKVVTMETILANAEPEDKEAWEGMKKEKKARKDNAVQTILKAEGNKFTEEELQAMPFDMLENIISMSPVKANYAGNGSVVKTEKKEVKANERQEDGSGVPLIPEARWNKDGTPDFSHLEA